MDDYTVFLGLAGISFLAATIFPAQSEATMAGLQIAGYPPFWLILVASVGNTLGAAVNWFLGKGIETYRDRRWFPVSPNRLDKASFWYQRWGKWSLLMSWMPVVGDALTVAAGVLRQPFGSFILIVAVAKTGRYIVLSLATAGFFQ